MCKREGMHTHPLPFYVDNKSSALQPVFQPDMLSYRGAPSFFGVGVRAFRRGISIHRMKPFPAFQPEEYKGAFDKLLNANQQRDPVPPEGGTRGAEKGERYPDPPHGSRLQFQSISRVPAAAEYPDDYQRIQQPGGENHTENPQDGNGRAGGFGGNLEKDRISGAQANRIAPSTIPSARR